MVKGAVLKEETSSVGAALKVKVEPKVKLERNVDKEEAKCKAELKAESLLKAEQGCKAEPNLKAERSCKVEVVSKRETLLKAEPLSKEEANGCIADLLRRGLEIREMVKKRNENAAWVKREPGKSKQGSQSKRVKVKRECGARKKKRCTAKVRKAARERMKNEFNLTPEFADVVGATALSRPEAVSRLWAHCRDRGMQNPNNKREILFNERLTRMFGVPSARMTDLISLINPHFDYAAGKVEALKSEVKGERGRYNMKREASNNVECKRDVAAKAERHQVGDSVKREYGVKNGGAGGLMKTESGDSVKMEPCPVKAKLERAEARVRAWTCSVCTLDNPAIALNCQACESSPPVSSSHMETVASPLKRERSFGHSNLVPTKQAKVEPGPVAPIPNARDVARAIAVQVCNIEQTAVDIEFTAPAEAFFQFVVLARPKDQRVGAPTVKFGPCLVLFRENSNTDCLEPYAEATLKGLLPGASYGIQVECVPVGNQAGREYSAEVVLPQRVAPSKWSPHEVLLWCSSLRVPELARKAREYAIDGTTLLSLGDDDLTALGLVAPFLRRRVLDSLAALRRFGALEK